MLLNINSKFLCISFKIIRQIHYSKKGTFNAPPETIFDVVKNTHKYNEFIPWCSRSSLAKIISNTENYTELTIIFQKIKQLSYLSHVKIQGESELKQNYKIQSTCKDQPLKSLVSIWEIEKNSIIEGDIEQTPVHYSIQYQFSSPLLQLTSHLFLNYVGESMWLIFKEQAEKRQILINQLKNKHNRDKLTFGKSKIVKPDDIFYLKQQPSNSQDFNQTPVKTLSQYLGKNSRIRQIYCKNAQFKKKLDQWSYILDGTNDFQDKLQFKIKNYMIHKN